MIDDYQSRLEGLRLHLAQALDGGLTSIELAKKISNGDQVISDRAIREFVKDKRKAFTGRNYDLVVGYMMQQNFVFEYIVEFSKFVSTMNSISQPIVSDLASISDICNLEMIIEYGEENAQEEAFYEFFLNNLLFNIPSDSNKILEEVVNRYIKKLKKEKIGFLELIAHSQLSLNAFDHVREINLFKDLFEERVNGLHIYGNILPRYLVKANYPQVCLIASAGRPYNPYIDHSEYERNSSGIRFSSYFEAEENSKRIPHLERQFHKSNFFSPPLRSVVDPY